MSTALLQPPNTARLVESSVGFSSVQLWCYGRDRTALELHYQEAPATCLCGRDTYHARTGPVTHPVSGCEFDPELLTQTPSTPTANLGVGSVVGSSSVSRNPAGSVSDTGNMQQARSKTDPVSNSVTIPMSDTASRARAPLESRV